MATIAEKLAEAAVTDSLNRTENPLATGWAILNPGASTGKCQTTAGNEGWTPVTSFAGGEDDAYWTKEPFAASANTYIYGIFTLSRLGSTEHQTGMWLCRDKTNPKETKNGYLFKIEKTATLIKYRLIRVVAGVEETVKEVEIGTYGKESQFAFVVGGGKLYMFARETPSSGEYVEVMSVADATYTEGYSGLRGKGTGEMVVKDFRTGTFTLTPESPRVRRFKGTGLMPRLSIGACNRTEDITIMAAVRIPTWDNTNDFTILGVAAEAGTARGYSLTITGGSSALSRGKLQLKWVDTAGGGEPTGFAGTPASIFPYDEHWKLVVVRKAAGAKNADFGIYDFFTQEWTWIESTENGGSVKAESQPTGRVVFGEANGFSKFKGDCCAGFIGPVKTRAEIEALVKKSTFTEWKAAASGLWFLDQEAAESAITDQTGNGANRVSGGAGTEVITPERPPIPYYNEVTKRAKVLVGGAIKSVKRWVAMNGATRQY